VKILAGNKTYLFIQLSFTQNINNARETIMFSSPKIKLLDKLNIMKRGSHITEDYHNLLFFLIS
jgi:hypothetical protein